MTNTLKSLRFILFAVAVLSGTTQFARANSSVVPSQWIAKQYTEFLGRAPSPAEWNQAITYFNQSGGCTYVNLKNFVVDLTNSNEFDTVYSENTSAERAARVVTMTRAALNRDPLIFDAPFATPYINGQADWNSIVNWAMGIYFASYNVPNMICNPESADYGFDYYGDQYFYNPVAGATPSRTQAQLQVALDAAAPGGVVFLEHGEVIRLGGSANGNQGLVIPATVTLATRGYPSRNQYALMGRLIPSASGLTCIWIFCSNVGMVRMEPGAALRSVWLDGHRAANDSDIAATRTSVVAISGSNMLTPTSVLDSRISNPGRDGAAIVARGNGSAGQYCDSLTIGNNLITGYSGKHNLSGIGKRVWADGIAVQCEQSLVTGNEIVDVSNRGIVLQGSWNSVTGEHRTQGSTVANNRILSAGISMYAALAADPAGECVTETQTYQFAPCLQFSHDNSDFAAPAHWPPSSERSFVGASIVDNEFWTGPNSHFDIAIMAGSKAFWGDNGPVGRGLQLSGNSTGVATARVHSGIVVSGMHDTGLANTSLSGLIAADQRASLQGDKCPVGLSFTDTTSSSIASTDISLTDTALDTCLYFHPPEKGLARLYVEGKQLLGLDDDNQERPYVAWGFQLNPVTNNPNGSFNNDMINDLRSDSTLREHLHMGANTLRVNVQYRHLMDDQCQPDLDAANELRETLRSASEHGIYVLLTGLGSYAGDPEDPVCYTETTDLERTARQAEFWAAMAELSMDEVVNDSQPELVSRPEVLALDLMNEPRFIPLVNAQGNPNIADCWTGPAPFPGAAHCLAYGLGSIFGQNTNRNQKAPGDPDFDQSVWMGELVGAIHHVDPHRLVTLGCHALTAALPCGGLEPAVLETHLDFISTHVYPVDCTDGAGPWWMVGGCNLTEASLEFQGGTPGPGDHLAWEDSVMAPMVALSKPLMVTETSFPADDFHTIAALQIKYKEDVVGWHGNWATVTISEIYQTPVPLDPNTGQPITGLQYDFAQALFGYSAYSGVLFQGLSSIVVP